MKIQGTLRPLRDNVFVTDMEFGMQKTLAGLYIPSDDGKSTGIHPRWGRVWAIGSDQQDVEVGDWILVEHGRWTRSFEYENDDGSITEFRMVENKSIMVISDEKPGDVQRNAPIGAGSNASFNIPGI
jgi:co-chaperonin GroES (HSP10)